MPYSKKPRRKYGRNKRQLKKKLRGFDKSIIQYAPLGGIPQKLATKLVYEDSVYTSSVLVGSEQEWIVRLNGLYDPDYSNLGRNGQPSGRDALVEKYSNYQVKAAKVTVTTAINTEGQTDQANVCEWSGAPFLTELDVSTPSVPGELQEMPMSKSGVATTFNGVVQKRSWYIDFKKLTGMSGKGSYSSGLGTIADQNPGNPLWFAMRHTMQGAISHYANLYRKIRIVYYVVFTGPRTSALLDT